MAADPNTFTSLDAVGNREDLSAIIYMVDPYDTPVLTRIASTGATNTGHEWQTQALRSPATDNARLSGDDATIKAVTPTVRLLNYTQIQDEVASVSGTQQSVTSAGRENELTYQEYLKTLELRRDMESTIALNQAKNQEVGATPRRMAGVPSWLVTNEVSDGGASAPTGDGTDTWTYGATPLAMNEGVIDSVLQKCWDSGGRPNSGYMSSTQKLNMRDLTGNATKYKNVEDRVNVSGVDYLESDLGFMIELLPDRFIPAENILFLQDDMWAASYLRPVQRRDLAVTGDSDKSQIITEWTLEARNEKSSGIAVNAATAWT